MKKLLVYLKEYKKECILGPLFKLLEASFELLVPLVMARMIDVGIVQNNNTDIKKMSIVLFVLALVGLLCSVTAQYFAAKAAVGFSAKLRHALFAHIQRLSFTEIDNLGAATMITRMTSDINQLQNGVNMVLRIFLRSPFIVFGAMIMAFTIDVKAALVFVCTIPALGLVVFGIMAITIPLYKKVQSALDGVLSVTRENLTGVRVLRAFAKEDSEAKSFLEKNNTLFASQRFVGRISALMNPLTYVVVNAGMILLIWTGAWRVDSGVISQGEVVALVNYMSQILVELIKLANLIVTITRAVACGNRVWDVFEIKPTINDAGERPDHDERMCLDADPTCSHMPIGNMTELSECNVQDQNDNIAVTFRKVCLTYKNSAQESLTNIDFDAKKGQTIGVIGGTGSGKSSLINLIPRFYDATKGKILINGIDICKYPLKDLRNRIGIVPQKSVLFSGTLRENLIWGKEHASDEEMWRALEIAQAKEFVEKKIDGLDMKISQGGRNLSGGQRQRLAIARALVKAPDILILDDSASALDFATDAALRKSLKDMKGETTIFIVSQRASSVMNADKIIVLDDGEMVGQGVHNELLNDCLVYQEIYHSQFERKQVVS